MNHCGSRCAVLFSSNFFRGCVNLDNESNTLEEAEMLLFGPPSIDFFCAGTVLHLNLRSTSKFVNNYIAYNSDTIDCSQRHYHRRNFRICYVCLLPAL